MPASQHLFDEYNRFIPDELRALFLGDASPDDDDSTLVMHSAMEVYERTRRSNVLADADLDMIATMAETLAHPTGDLACALLVNLSIEFPAAAERVQRIMSTAKARLRGHLVHAAAIYAPDSAFTRNLLRNGLNDRAASVRRRAIEWSDHSLIPELEQRQDVETNEELLELLDESLQHLTGNYRVNPDPGNVKYHSFYRRVEQDGEHFVVNSVLENRWLQLDVVFHDRRRLVRRVEWDDIDPMTKGVQAKLEPRKVVRHVLDGIRKESLMHGRKLDAEYVRFSQSDFDCYDLYEHAARLLVREILTGGKEFRQLIIAAGGDSPASAGQ